MRKFLKIYLGGKCRTTLSSSAGKSPKSSLLQRQSAYCTSDIVKESQWMVSVKRNPWKGFLHSPAFHSQFLGKSYKQRNFINFIRMFRSDPDQQSSSLWSSWSLSWLMTMVVIMVTIRFNQKKHNLRNDVNSSSETVILWSSTRICSCWSWRFLIRIP